MIDQNLKEVIDSVKRMVSLKLLEPEHEVFPDSYVCFVTRNSEGKSIYHAGLLSKYEYDLQCVLVGAFLNETIDNYKVVGIYRVMDGIEYSG